MSFTETIKETVDQTVEGTRKVLDTTEGKVATGVLAGLLAIYAAYRYINRNR